MRYLVLGLGLALLLSTGLFAEQVATAAAPSASSSDVTTILAKLDQILANQERLSQRLDAVDEQLKIIRVRASQKH